MNGGPHDNPTGLLVANLAGGAASPDVDEDVDEEALSVFAGAYGGLVWYKDADGDGYSDGRTQTSLFPPANHYSPSDLDVIF